MTIAYSGYKAFKITVADGIARVTVDSPPLNLMDAPMIGEIIRLIEQLRGDAAVRVVVFDSADRDFFMNHADMNLFVGIERSSVPPKSSQLNPLQIMFENLRTLPKATIAILEGRAMGGGTEFLLACDMIFAARGKAVLSLFEVALGGLPGATGTQRLPRVLGRARALEVILGCDDFNADLAERYGYVNRALEPDQLRPFVDRLAHRIASFPPRAVAVAKAAVDASP
jgi:enoyl-CoA hydratase/carnithine racemase